MSLKKIIRKNIEDSAVTEPKIANEAITVDKISDDFVTGLTELSEQAANDDTLLIYDTSAGLLKKVSKSNTTVLDSPTVSSVSPTSVVSDAGTTTFTITGTGFTDGTNARLIGSNGRVRNFATVTKDSTTQITATINVTTDMIEVETPYGVQVINGKGLNDLLVSQIDIDQYPVFVTASGSLGSSRFNMSGVEVNATDPDSAASVTFELQSGSLPPGISITNTSANGGTATFTGNIVAQSSDTTYNFTLRAVDAASNTSSRAFSFTALGPSTESFTSSGTFSVPTGATSVDVLVVAGGGSGGGNASGGAGAGGLIFMPSYPVTPSGTLTVTVGEGGPAGGSPCTRSVGQDSTFGSPGDPGLTPTGGVLTAKGGGWGGNLPGGSGGGSPFSAPAPGSATQPTQPGNSGAYGFGNAGGNGNYTGQSVGGGPYTGGGGGGAGATGGNSTNSGSGGGSAGNGGDGKAYTIADGTTSVYYAGGAGGNSTSSGAGAGGQGGGGQGGDESGNCGTAGEANKGGGGGGKQNSPTAHAGGKGVVIVRY